MTPPTARPRGPRGPLLATLVLLLVAFAGGMAGVAIDRLVLLPQTFRGRGFEHGPRREFRDRFAREVGLSAEQRSRIDSIMARQGRELRTVRGTVQPQLDSIISRTRRQIDSVLTPEQRKKAEEIRRRHPRPPGPPPAGEFPPDGRGGPGRPPPGRPPS